MVSVAELQRSLSDFLRTAAPIEGPDSPGRRLFQATAIVLVSLAINLVGNGRVSLWDRDEPRYAGCVREMRERGDWLHPTFNGEPRYQKPVLIYWLMRAGVAVGGDNPFGARLVSGLAGMGTCLVVWGLGRRMFGPRAGFLAALMLATAPIMVAESKLATTDATLTFWLVGCQACLWELSRRASPWAAAGFWALLALATLTKGPVGIALVAVSGLASWWWGGPTECWRRLRWRWGVPGFVLLVAPWCIAIGLISKGEFYRVALGQQLLERITTVKEQHGGFPGYYLVTTLGMFYPWSALLPAGLYGAWSRRKGRPELGFLLGWVVGPLLLLECSRTKIVHYYAPSYPACALLGAWLIGLIAPEGVNLRRWPLGRLATGLLGGIGIGLTVALIALGVIAPWPLRWPALVMAAVLAAGTLYALQKFMQGGAERAAACLVATWGATMLAFGAWILPAVEPYKQSRIVGERLAVLSAAHGAQPVLLTFREPSTVYALGRPAPELPSWEVLYGLIDRHGAVIIPLFPHELKVFRATPEVRVEDAGAVHGFNLSKGKPQELHFAVVRRSALASGSPAGEQPLVK